jgi:hypothetical protein
MKYVFGIIKRFNYTKTENHTRKGRKYYFCYEFDMESGQFKRVRISTFKAIYYKITFVFGLKAKRITNIYCEDCRKHHDSIVNFWDKNISCPYC